MKRPLVLLAAGVLALSALQPALAGNHVMIQTPAGPVVVLCHLQQGSARVRLGEHVAADPPGSIEDVPAERLGEVSHEGGTGLIEALGKLIEIDAVRAVALEIP